MTAMPARPSPRLATVAFLLVLLAGCATPPPVPPTGEERSPRTLEQWSLKGKLGYRAPDDNGSAWLNWRQDGESWELRLHGPLGAGATRIRGDAQRAVLERAGAEPVVAANAAALSHRIFGWSFPVAQMRAWIRGLPAPDAPVASLERDDAGRLANLEQSGWQLSFEDYARHGHWQLPGRIRGQRGELGFTLVINEWRPGEAF